LQNYAAIMENATEAHQGDMNEILPRLWFNQVTSSSNALFGNFNNDVRLNEMMGAEFPDVDTLSNAPCQSPHLYV